MRKSLIAVAIALLFAVVASVAAYATMPGKNGRIAFRRYFNDAHTSSGLFTINADGSEEQKVTRAPVGYFDDQPDWAPDGSLLAFTRCPANGPCAVYTVRADGSALKRLSKPCARGAHETTCPDNANVAFSPDGRQIAFTESSGHVKRDKLVDNIIERSAIVLMDRNGGNRRTVIHSAPYVADYSWPQFSPDGSRIVYEHATRRVRSRQESAPSSSSTRRPAPSGGSPPGRSQAATTRTGRRTARGSSSARTSTTGRPRTSTSSTRTAPGSSSSRTSRRRATCSRPRRSRPTGN